MPIKKTRNQQENDLDFLDRLKNLGTLLTVKELARILAISEKTIYGYVARNMIPYLKIQSSVRFRPKHIAQWLGCNDPFTDAVEVRKKVRNSPPVSSDP